MTEVLAVVALNPVGRGSSSRAATRIAVGAGVELASAGVAGAARTAQLYDEAQAPQHEG